MSKRNKSSGNIYDRQRELGVFVVNLLSVTPDWDADMTDMIAQEAIELGLADTDAHGVFRGKAPKGGAQ